MDYKILVHVMFIPRLGRYEHENELYMVIYFYSILIYHVYIFLNGMSNMKINSMVSSKIHYSLLIHKEFNMILTSSFC